jgi:hypothetical protein
MARKPQAGKQASITETDGKGTSGRIISENKISRSGMDYNWQYE